MGFRQVHPPKPGEDGGQHVVELVRLAVRWPDRRHRYPDQQAERVGHHGDPPDPHQGDDLVGEGLRPLVLAADQSLHQLDRGQDSTRRDVRAFVAWHAATLLLLAVTASGEWQGARIAAAIPRAC
jgi:hypothetical protein